MVNRSDSKSDVARLAGSNPVLDEGCSDPTFFLFVDFVSEMLFCCVEILRILDAGSGTNFHEARSEQQFSFAKKFLLDERVQWMSFNCTMWLIMGIN